MRKATTRLGLLAACIGVVGVLGAAGPTIASAFANEFKLTSYPGEVLAHATQEQVFTVEGGKLVCKKASFGPKTVSGASSELHMSASYTECEGIGSNGAKSPATVKMNECEYDFHAGSGTSPSKSVGTVDVVCPSGHEIEITAATCTTKVPAQTGLASMEYILLSSGKAEVIPLVKGIKYTTTSGLFCPLKGGTFSNGTYKGATEAEASVGGPITEV